jgi:hypothetical protein
MRRGPAAAARRRPRPAQMRARSDWNTPMLVAITKLHGWAGCECDADMDR